MRAKRIGCMALALCCAAALLCGCGGDGGEKPQLVIGCVENYPYVYSNEDGQMDGVDVAIAREACQRMGYTAVFEKLGWDERSESLQSGAVDCLWSRLALNGALDGCAWVGPYMYCDQVVAVPEDSDIQTVDDLAGRTVAVRRDSRVERLFLEESGDGMPQLKNVYSLTSAEEVAVALQNEYVDACAGDEAVLKELLEATDTKYRFLKDVLLRVEIGVAFPEDGDEALRRTLAETLREMRADGTLSDILERFGMDTRKALGRVHR